MSWAADNSSGGVTAFKSGTDQTGKPSWGVWLIWLYTFWLLTTPYESPRMEFLVSVRFERLLAFVLAVYSLTAAGSRKRDPIPIFLFSTFFLVSLIAAVLSPYPNVPAAQFWFANYWKSWLLYLFIVPSLRTKEDVRLSMVGASAIWLGYQLLSWRDFLSGGSYVYQQGIKRIVGVWSGGGIGAANAFAFTTLFILPMSYCWIINGSTSRRRLLSITCVVVSIASLVFSGTRGAILVLVIVTGGTILMFSRNRARYVLFSCVAGLACYVIAPPEIRHRYTSQLLPFATDAEAEDSAEHLAQGSAEGRIDGLVDGWLLFRDYPILGCGPGTSGTARMYLNKKEPRETPLELHSLYGQLLAETGLCGASAFVALNWHLVASLVRTLRGRSGVSRQLSIVLLVTFAVNLLYGFVSHTLYRDGWVFLFGYTTVVASESANERDDNAPC